MCGGRKPVTSVGAGLIALVLIVVWLVILPRAASRQQQTAAEGQRRPPAASFAVPLSGTDPCLLGVPGRHRASAGANTGLQTARRP